MRHKPVLAPRSDTLICEPCSNDRHEDAYVEVMGDRLDERELVLWKDCTWHADHGLPKPTNDPDWAVRSEWPPVQTMGDQALPGV